MAQLESGVHFWTNQVQPVGGIYNIPRGALEGQEEKGQTAWGEVGGTRQAKPWLFPKNKNPRKTEREGMPLNQNSGINPWECRNTRGTPGVGWGGGEC